MDIKSILEICIFVTILLLVVVLTGVVCYDVWNWDGMKPSEMPQETWDMLGEMYARNECDMRAYKRVARSKRHEYKHKNIF